LGRGALTMSSVVWLCRTPKADSYLRKEPQAASIVCRAVRLQEQSLQQTGCSGGQLAMVSTESIYALIPQPVPVTTKPAMYHSKHPGNAPPTFSTFGLAGTSKPGYTNIGGDGPVPEPTGYGKHSYTKATATFGKEGNAVAASDVMKKGTGMGGGAAALDAEVVPFDRSGVKKVPVPTVNQCMAEAMSKPAREDKNFVTSNAVENILSVPRRAPEPVDWKAKPHYGKVPPYLQKIKKEISDEYEYIRTMQQSAEDAGPAGMRQLEEGERLELVDQLKAKWDEVNATYQRSSVLSLASLDTIGKVKRKEKYEATLAQIERDIEKLSKKVVYVTMDDMSY